MTFHMYTVSHSHCLLQSFFSFSLFLQLHGVDCQASWCISPIHEDCGKEIQNRRVRSLIVYESLEFIFKTIFIDNADTTITVNKFWSRLPQTGFSILFLISNFYIFPFPLIGLLSTLYLLNRIFLFDLHFTLSVSSSPRILSKTVQTKQNKKQRKAMGIQMCCSLQAYNFSYSFSRMVQGSK